MRRIVQLTLLRRRLKRLQMKRSVPLKLTLKKRLKLKRSVLLNQIQKRNLRLMRRN